MHRARREDLPPGTWLVDLRDDLERAARPMRGAPVVAAELDDLLAGVAPGIPRGAAVVAACVSGLKAELAAAALEALGWDDCGFAPAVEWLD
ncbi:MAG TPA: hypothetical protein VHN99_03455 [Deinococcales bacterium]|nr:hypothetical protein [Deinococcales bacterium]